MATPLDFLETDGKDKRAVHLQRGDSCSACRRLADQGDAGPSKMIGPTLPSWMLQRNRATR
jgi:hypothetical protein